MAKTTYAFTFSRASGDLDSGDIADFTSSLNRAMNMLLESTGRMKKGDIRAALGVESVSVFLVCDSQGNTNAYLTKYTKSRQPYAGAVEVAKVLKSKATPLENVEFSLPRHRYWSTSEAPRNESLTSSSAAGVNPLHVAENMVGVIQPNEWIGFSVRALRSRERTAMKMYIDARGGIGQSSPAGRPTALVTNMYASSDEPDRPYQMLRQLNGALPNRTVEEIRKWPSFRPAKKFKPTIILATLAAMLGLYNIVNSKIDPWLNDAFSSLLVDRGIIEAGQTFSLPDTPLPVLVGLGIAAAACAVLSTVHLVPTRYARVERHLKRNALPRPPLPYHPFARYRLSSAHKRNREVNGQGQIEFSQGTVHKNLNDPNKTIYPLDNRNIVLPVESWIGIVRPRATEQSTTVERLVPRPLIDRTGVVAGHSQDTPVYLPSSSTRLGVSLLGTPGSGKSATLHTHVAYMMADKECPTGLPGDPGKHNAIVVVEEDQSSIESILHWATIVGAPAPYVVKAVDHEGYVLDMFGDPSTYPSRQSWGANVASVWRESFADGSIMARSQDAVRITATAASFVNDDVVSLARDHDRCTLAQDETILYYMYALMGGIDGDANAKPLFEALREYSQSHPSDEELATAVGSLSTLFSKTPRERDSYFDSPRNKVGLLMQIAPMIFPTRHARVEGRVFTWEDIINDYATLLVTAGSARVDGVNQTLPTEVSNFYTAALARTLRDKVPQLCVDWGAQGKQITVVFDEVSRVVGTTTETVEWWLNEGRKYGVKPFYATQNLKRVPDKVVDVLLATDTFIAMRQRDTNQAEIVLQRIGATSMVSWAPEDITTLPDYHALISTSARGATQPSFTVKSAFWGDTGDDARRAFVTDNGWDYGADGRLVRAEP